MYDLAWYLAERNWPKPNFPFLNNALNQPGWSGLEVTQANWRELVAEKLEKIQWDQAAKDVSPFLERSKAWSSLPLTTLRASYSQDDGKDRHRLGGILKRYNTVQQK
jgi:hypothetical protein